MNYRSQYIQENKMTYIIKSESLKDSLSLIKPSWNKDLVCGNISISINRFNGYDKTNLYNRVKSFYITIFDKWTIIKY